MASKKKPSKRGWKQNSPVPKPASLMARLAALAQQQANENDRTAADRTYRNSVAPTGYADSQHPSQCSDECNDRPDRRQVPPANRAGPPVDGVHAPVFVVLANGCILAAMTQTSSERARCQKTMPGCI